MKNDNWSSYKKFKAGRPSAVAYYDLVKTAFETGVQQICAGGKMTRAIDLGCGSGELTRALRAFADHVTGIDASPALIEPPFEVMIGQKR